MPAVLVDLRYISRLLATRASVTNLVPKRFKVFKMVAGGACVALFVKFPALLFMVSRKAREPGVSDTENRAKREEDYPPFLLLFWLSFVKPYFNIFFIPIWTLREARNGHISSLQFDGQFNRLGCERLRGILGIGKIPNWGWYIFSDLREVGPGTCFFFYRIVF